MKKVYFFNISGCSGISLDRAHLEDYFLANDCEVVSSPEKADVIFVLTCAYDKSCEDLSVKAISSLKRYKGELIVGGCLPEIDERRMRQVHAGRWLSTKKLGEIDALFPGFKKSFRQIPEAHRFAQPRLPEKARVFFSFSGFFFRNFFLKAKNRLRGFSPAPATVCVRVARGCLGDCSYCAVKKAIGVLKSKPMEAAVEEARKLVENGHKRLHLISEDTGAWGLDIGSALPELLQRLVSLRRDLRLDIPCLHPVWLLKYREDFLDLARRGNIAWLSCAIQSGNPRILKLMNRETDLAALEHLLAQMKKADPKMQVITHAIAGFPSETEEEFQDTIDLVKRVRFDSAFFFSCHIKPGTRAESLGPRVPDKEIQRRIHRAVKELRGAGISCFQATLPNADLSAS